MKDRPLLYVAAPWRRRTNMSMSLVAEAIRLGIAFGWAPVFAPFLFDGHLDDENEDDRRVIFELNRSILSRCGALVVASRPLTEGMAREVDYWMTTGLTLFEGSGSIGRAPS